MLAPSYESEPVQAFPISLRTVQGTLTDESCSNRSVLHIDADCTVTFTFSDDTTLVRSCLLGEDYGLTRDVKSLTSDGAVILG